MALQLFDTMSREVREVFPMDEKSVRFYSCGPTVYGPAHIGNFRTFVMQDIFEGLLKLLAIKLFMSEILLMLMTRQFVSLKRKGLNLKFSLTNGRQGFVRIVNC